MPIAPGEDPLAALSAELEAFMEARTAPSSAVAPAPPAKIVLVIDDNRDYRGLVESLLKDHGLDVLQAADGAEGLKILLNKHPDLVIVDFNMPRMNGYEFIQEVKSLFEFRKIPIIMFSGASNRRHIKTLDLDIVEFLDKPLSNSRLLEVVERTLGLIHRPSAPTIQAPPVPVHKEPPAAPPTPAPPEAPIQTTQDPWLDGRELSDVEMLSEERRPQEAQEIENLANDSPLINQVNKILIKAVQMRASDIHIEPQEKQTAVRVRVDGSLKSLCSLPARLHARLAARVKIMSNLVITEHRLPQDGQFRVQIKGQKTEFRVSTLPSTYGEKIVLRVLGQSKLMGDLLQLGLSPRDLECSEKAVKSPNGLVLVTGPTGSGKTTTLYTMLAVLNTPEVNIMTVEDPVEYRLDGITQVPVQATIGLTFESVLRAFLRQDPNVMLVGEIRDKETADIAIKASITGHLVLSTLHTNGAPATITRLTHMGLAPYLVSASVKLVVAQRLVKLLCPACKLRAPVSEEAKRCLTENELGRLREVYRGSGCESCSQTGVAGRKPIFEVMPVRTTAMRQAILSGCSVDGLTDLAVKEGMTTLRQAALAEAASGSTSLPEALKIMMAE